MKNLRIISLFLCALLLAALACGKTTVTPPPSTERGSASPPLGESEHTLTVGGLERSYFLRVLRPMP